MHGSVVFAGYANIRISLSSNGVRGSDASQEDELEAACLISII